jgi:choice-of-anchor A domain-containing protein
MTPGQTTRAADGVRLKFRRRPADIDSSHPGEGRMTQPTRKRNRLTVEALEARDVPSAYDLGDAAQFNALFFTEMIASNSDAEGRIAVGWHADIRNYGIGEKLLPDNTRDDLIVGADLEFFNGQVFNGNIVYGGIGHLQSVGTPFGSTRQQANVLPFATIQQDLTTKSLSWGGEAPDGHTTTKYSNLNLRGMSPDLDIFTVTAAQLAAAKTICLIVPFGATVLINVPDPAASIQNLGFKLRGADAGHILWNFPNATQLTVSGVGLKGSVLAPMAHLDFNNGTITGAVIADTMAGNGQFNLTPINIHIQIRRDASVSGEVFVDDDANDNLDFGESGYPGAEVDLTGTDYLGRPVSLSTMSLFDGTYAFGPISPGTYTVQVVLPQAYSSTNENGIPGTVGGFPMGTGDVNKVKSIVLGDGDAGLDYQLPLVPNPN